MPSPYLDPGEPVSWRPVGSAKELRAGVTATLSDLIGVHKVDRRNIAVLTGAPSSGIPL